MTGKALSFLEDEIYLICNAFEKQNITLVKPLEGNNIEEIKWLIFDLSELCPGLGRFTLKKHLHKYHLVQEPYGVTVHTRNELNFDEYLSYFRVKWSLVFMYDERIYEIFNVIKQHYLLWKSLPTQLTALHERLMNDPSELFLTFKMSSMVDVHMEFESLNVKMDEYTSYGDVCQSTMDLRFLPNDEVTLDLKIWKGELRVFFNYYDSNFDSENLCSMSLDDFNRKSTDEIYDLVKEKLRNHLEMGDQYVPLETIRETRIRQKMPLESIG